MEEAVTRKFVHEESSSITSLCAAVEACLSEGLKRRTLGLFKTSSTTALLHKVAKNLEAAMHISKLVQDIENSDPNKRSSSSSDSTNKSKPSVPKKPPPGTRYLWIRLALFEKQLAKIIDHLVQNSSKYYEKDALVADPVDGHILASLLVGPCALDYSKMKTQDHFWTDPPADELVQRHRISSAYPTLPSTPPTARRPGLHFRRGPLNTASSEDYRNLPVSARDYVESLHQNSKATLLYGKNNVHVQPKENVEPLPGYLSLHQVADALTIKWTPNQLMNGCCAENEANTDNNQSKEDKRCPFRQRSFFRQTSKPDEAVYWDYALNVNVREIVYVHCHQQAHIGGTVVLVGQDGVQRPPIHFPKGGHLLAFLSCLENGLLPHGQLDPPLWSQRGKGKVFPRLRRKGRNQVVRSEGEGDEDDEEETSDYVFRILNHIKPDAITQELMDPKFNPRGISFPWLSRDAAPTPSATTGSGFGLGGLGLISGISLRHPSTRSSSSTSSSKSLSLTEESLDGQQRHSTTNGHSGTSLQILCDTMKRQIISRAFYGWLAHCRHLRTVRTHLSGLVHTTVVSIEQPSDASKGVTLEVWKTMHTDDKISDAMEVYRLTYFGGVQHEIRKEVWPYLLGHYQFDSAPEERQAQDEAMHHQYENTMSEWLAVEAIVRQRDKEIMAAQLAKLSSESTNGEIPLIGRDHTLSNEVFEDNLSITSDDNQDVEVGDDETGQDEDHVTCKAESKNTCNAVDETEKTANVGMSIPKVSKTPVTPDEGLGNGKYDDEELESTKTDNHHSERIVVMNPSVDSGNPPEIGDPMESDPLLKADDSLHETKVTDALTIEDIPEGISQGSHSACLSPVSSNGGVYSVELLDSFALNLHRIDKDVQRCDRNYKYFAEPENLEKLRNVMCTYVWEHLEIGYVQGMCDLVAPLLVIFDDESMTYSCFCELMKRMAANFPHGGAMDSHFANMRSLIQILDSEMFELMHQNGDYTHFYFCYRWFLLDFKRELLYDDVFSIWETIWAARHVASAHIVLFIALALVEFYRDIILNNNMDFTDIIKFFNEMAEHHNATAILKLARELVLQLQTLIDNK